MDFAVHALWRRIFCCTDGSISRGKGMTEETAQTQRVNIRTSLNAYDGNEVAVLGWDTEPRTGRASPHWGCTGVKIIGPPKWYACDSVGLTTVTILVTTPHFLTNTLGVVTNNIHFFPSHVSLSSEAITLDCISAVITRREPLTTIVHPQLGEGSEFIMISQAAIISAVWAIINHCWPLSSTTPPMIKLCSVDYQPLSTTMSHSHPFLAIKNHFLSCNFWSIAIMSLDLRLSTIISHILSFVCPYPSSINHDITIMNHYPSKYLVYQSTI